MLDFTEVKYRQRVGSTGQQVIEVWWKDCVQEQRAYTYFTQKLAESYENFQNKAKFMRPFIQKIFINVPTFSTMACDALIKGFFFVFVHKDFIVREIVARVQD